VKFAPLEIVWKTEDSLDDLKGKSRLRGGHFRVKRRLTLKTVGPRLGAWPPTQE
jgi:hypothetical protein